MPESNTAGVTFVSKANEADVIAESTEATKEQAQQDAGVKLVPIHNSLSAGTRVVAKDSKGRFAKNAQRQLQKDLDVAASVEAGIQKLLQSPAKDKEGNVLKDEHGKPIPRYLKAVERLLDMVSDLKDEKAIGGSSKALAEILTRALGAPSRSPKERAENQISPIKTVHVFIPVGVPEEKPEEKRPDKPQKPSWISAENVKTNPPTNRDVVENSEQ